jgi:hypothetical protein
MQKGLAVLGVAGHALSWAHCSRSVTGPAEVVSKPLSICSTTPAPTIRDPFTSPSGMKTGQLRDTATPGNGEPSFASASA